MNHALEIESGQRFEFGRNWAQYLEVLDQDRIAVATRSLQDMLGLGDLTGKRFLDIGCGSGLFSLCAHHLGAEVHSLDFDPQSVACAEKLRAEHGRTEPHWIIEEASVLDAQHMASLGPFDVVYSWGVLHHTGDMWRALANAATPVRPGGQLFISIYNDQGMKSKLWSKVKRTYCSGTLCRWAMTAVGGGVIVFGGLKADLVRGRNPLARYAGYRQRRGMNAWHDVKDWLGGYPFEVAKPEAIFDFYRDLGFTLTRLTTDGGGSGTNQYVFRRG